VESKTIFLSFRRHKVVNHFSIMLQKRLRDDDGSGDLLEEEKKSKKGKGDMMITDMEDWVDDDGIGDEDSDEDEEAKEKKKKSEFGSRDSEIISLIRKA